MSAHSFALDLLPIIGDAKGLIEVFTGKDLLTGEGLGAWRWARLLGLSEIRQLRHLDKLPLQLHHFATNKNIRYTARMEEIAQSFGLSLNGGWNLERLPHRGRHPNEYHDFVLLGMRRASNEARGSTEEFLRLFELYVKEPIRQNPELLRKSGWGK